MLYYREKNPYISWRGIHFPHALLHWEVRGQAHQEQVGVSSFWRTLQEKRDAIKSAASCSQDGFSKQSWYLALCGLST